jgi:dolichol-phosphate mannosyltransferase
MPPKFSVVVPTYKEAGNIEPLTRRLFAALKSDGSYPDGSVELIFVDDNSPDDSVQKVKAVQADGLPARIIVRKTERGLSSAVIHGIRQAQGEYVLVMDADLQHPPEYVPNMLAALTSGTTEFVLGTRYGAGVAIDKDWPVHRRIISWGARLLARPLTPLSDPMSGFFGIRKAVFVRGESRIDGIGYKIALEIFVKCRVKKYKEVGFSFASRTVGESKLTGKVIVHYLQHLKKLYTFAYGSFTYMLLVCFFGLALYMLLIFSPF